VTVAGLNGIVGMDAGANHTCAWLGDGSARCWGDNDYGQLGNDTTADSPTAVRIAEPAP
jgi:alpha-tubulin suppressor-like RCC1 family protein